MAMRTQLLIMLTIFLSMIVSHAQENNTHKNVIYLSYGTVIFSDQFSLAYERTIYSNTQLSTNLKVAYGRYLSNNADFETGATVYQQYWSISGVQLIQFVEVNVGIAYTEYILARGFNPLPEVDYSAKQQALEFYGNVGCRWRKNSFLFRFGIGNLELLYLGVGLSF